MRVLSPICPVSFVAFITQPEEASIPLLSPCSPFLTPRRPAVPADTSFLSYQLCMLTLLMNVTP